MRSIEGDFVGSLGGFSERSLALGADAANISLVTSLIAAEIVDDDEIAGPERQQNGLLGTSEKAPAVNLSVKH